MTYLFLFSAVYLLNNYESALIPQCAIHRHDVLQAEVREKEFFLVSIGETLPRWVAVIFQIKNYFIVLGQPALF